MLLLRDFGVLRPQALGGRGRHHVQQVQLMQKVCRAAQPGLVALGGCECWGLRAGGRCSGTEQPRAAGCATCHCTHLVLGSRRPLITALPELC